MPNPSPAHRHATAAAAPTGREAPTLAQDQQVVLVAAVAANGVIGRDGQLPWHVPDDLAHFKTVTMGHPMIMGRRTFEAIGRPLPGRRSIVVTRNPRWRASSQSASSDAGVEVCSSFRDALATAGPGTVMVVGGGEIYRQALPWATHLELSRMHAEYEGDTRFPDLDESEWQEVGRTGYPDFDAIRYRRV